MILLLCRLALAHGGEDHGAAPPPLALSADSARAAAASALYEAIVLVQTGPLGTPVASTLLLADFSTSAPVEGASATLSLSGPASLDVTYVGGTPGVYEAQPSFSAAGEYAGALVVSAAAGADLLAISGLHIGPAPVAAAGSDGWVAAGVCAALAGFTAVGVVMAGLGYAVGRRRGMAAATALALAAGAQRVSAHGGEDHGGPAPASPMGAGLPLPLESQFLLGLRTIRAVNDRFQDQVQALGHFVSRPGESATLRAPVAGVLLAPPGGFPAPGAHVSAGDLLAQIQETPGRVDRAALGQARSDAGTRVAEARAALALAERDAAQAESLGDAISDREQLTRQQAVAVAREALRQAEGARSAAGSGATLEIRAPLGGTLGPTAARPGDQIEAGSALFRVSDVVGLWMEAQVPERLALGLTPGSPATVTTGSSPGHVLPATVLDAGQEADPRTGTVLVTLSVQGEDLDFRPGFGARAWIGRGPTRDTMVVPDSAIVDSNGAALAFVKTGPESFETREVKLGGRAGGEVEVLEGIHPGDRVVTEGTYALRSLAGR